METQKLNLFIIDGQRSIATDLENHLISSFGERLNITTFDDGQDCLQNLNKNTHIVIVDHDVKDQKQAEIVRTIKKRNSNIKVILLLNHGGLGKAADSFRRLTNNSVLKNTYWLKKTSLLIRKLLTDPIRYIIKEYSVPTFMAVFLSTFIIMGIAVYIFLQYKL
jgi:DNA-binding NtrC family response regulator